MTNCEKAGHKVEHVNVPFNAKTVVLYGQDNVLNWYLNFLLSNHEGWRLIEISNEMRGDFPTLHELEYLQPDVVIVCRTYDDQNEHIPTELLETYPNIKTITINLENNYIEINNREKIQIGKLSDFLSIIEK